MADYQVTLIFEGKQKGWTEGYSITKGIERYELMKPFVQKLATARARLLGKECFIKAYRISKHGTGPDGQLFRERFEPIKEKIPEIGIIGLEVGTASLDTCLLVRAVNEPGTRTKNIFLRGIWDEVESNAGTYVPSIGWQFLFERWKAAVIADQWGWYGVTQTRGPAPVKGAVQKPGGEVEFETKAAFFLNDEINKRTRIRVSGVNKKSRYNGLHVVVVDSTTKATTVDALGVGPYHTGGQIRMGSKGVIPIFDLTPATITTRQTGAPLLESPGRQAAQPKA